jgi:outer membrane protein assembly factor BamB
MRDIGRGYSGFVIAEGRLYTQGQTLAGQYVYCLDSATGDTLWDCRYGDAYGIGGMYPGPRATPTYSDGRLYFAGPRGVVGCVDAEDGELRWTRNIVDEFGAPEFGFGYACTPVI